MTRSSRACRSGRKLLFSGDDEDIAKRSGQGTGNVPKPAAEQQSEGPALPGRAKAVATLGQPASGDKSGSSSNPSVVNKRAGDQAGNDKAKPWAVEVTPRASTHNVTPTTQSSGVKTLQGRFGPKDQTKDTAAPNTTPTQLTPSVENPSPQLVAQYSFQLLRPKPPLRNLLRLASDAFLPQGSAPIPLASVKTNGLDKAPVSSSVGKIPSHFLTPVSAHLSAAEEPHPPGPSRRPRPHPLPSPISPTGGAVKSILIAGEPLPKKKSKTTKANRDMYSTQPSTPQSTNLHNYKPSIIASYGSLLEDHLNDKGYLSGTGDSKEAASSVPTSAAKGANDEDKSDQPANNAYSAEVAALIWSPGRHIGTAFQRRKLEGPCAGWPEHEDHISLLQDARVVEALDKKRQPFAALEAIYIMVPSDESIGHLIGDFHKQSCIVQLTFFIAKCSATLFSKLGRSSCQKDCYSPGGQHGILPYESNVFTLDNPQAFDRFYSPTSQGKSELVEKIAEKLSTVVPC
eukprot:Em0016g79a